MCGIFGIANHSDAAQMTYLGLYALQHRGQESTGISSSDGDQVHTHKSMGYVADVFSEDVLSKLKGNNAIGHTRYSTAGDSNEGNAHPIRIRYFNGCAGRNACAGTGRIFVVAAHRRFTDRGS